MPRRDKNFNIPTDLSDRLAACDDLPSLPAAVIKIIDASRDPDIGIADVANILKVDPALSAKLLKVANSPMYAKQREISSLLDALSILGLNASITISLGFSLVSALQSSTNTAQIYDSFWRRCILSATIARQIGVTLNLKNTEELFLTSLLQDIGILALDRINPDTLIGNCNLNHQSRMQCESNHWGVDHANIGAWLLKSWHFPEKIYNAVLQSHTSNDTLDMSDSNALFFQCIHLSGKLSDIWFEKEKVTQIENTFNSMNQLFNFTQEDFNQFINTVDTLLPEMSKLFDVTLLNDNDREKVLNEARLLLIENSINLIKQRDEHQEELKSLSEKTKRIEDASNKDHLTNIYNRKRIEDLLADEFLKSKTRQSPLSLAFIDIDDFKPINDTYGHLAGDEVLKAIAQFFKQNIRGEDIIARYGGDEFLLMLPNTNANEARQLLKRIILELQSFPGTQIDGNLLKVSTSIGMATHMGKVNYDNPRDLINSADKALYKSKQLGKNTITCF